MLGRPMLGKPGWLQDFMNLLANLGIDETVAVSGEISRDKTELRAVPGGDGETQESWNVDQSGGDERGDD